MDSTRVQMTSAVLLGAGTGIDGAEWMDGGLALVTTLNLQSVQIKWKGRTPCVDGVM